MSPIELAKESYMHTSPHGEHADRLVVEYTSRLQCNITPVTWLLKLKSLVMDVIAPIISVRSLSNGCEKPTSGVRGREECSITILDFDFCRYGSGLRPKVSR